MLESGTFRELLIADLAVVGEVAAPADVAVALQHFWAQRDLSIVDELVRIADLPPDVLADVVAEADRRIAAAGGDAHAALTRHGGLQGSLYAALAQRDARLSTVLTRVGAGAPAGLRPLPEDRYLEFSVAGEGGMGVVYMALDTELNRCVAFKLVRSRAGAGGDGATPITPVEAAAPPRDTPASRAFEELKARFLQEAWIAGGLEHPGVVPVYELGQTSGGVPYYTMRFVRGQQTLRDAIDRTRATPVLDRLALLEPFLKLCDTVRYAHSRGVIHRDLKPENVALGQFGEVVLLDWGLAKLTGRDDLAASRWQERVRDFREAGDLSTVASALGTPGYMSPEAALGQLDQVDQKSDVYSLGVLLYEILTGSLPFPLTTYAEYIDCVSRREAPAARAGEPLVPEALSDLCARCLDRDRTKRPEDVASLSQEIRAWQAASAIEREVEGHLRDARSALDAAAAATGDARLTQVDRAAASLALVAEKQPGSATLATYERRAKELRESGIRERERASGRRLLARTAAAVLALAAGAAMVVAGILDRQRRAAETAREDAAYERDAKAQALDDVLRLSDSKIVRDLIGESDELWPVHPRRVAAMAAWLERTAVVLSNRADHLARWSQLRDSALPPTEEQRLADRRVMLGRLAATRARRAKYEEELAGLAAKPPDRAIRKRKALAEGIRVAEAEVAALEPRVSERQTWVFESPDDDWMHQVLEDLLAGLDQLESSRGDVATRLTAAKTLRTRSVEAHANAWRETIAEIAASASYGGLRLEPQLGLVPLGPDPESGLFEFAHVSSGSLPQRDPKTRKLVCEDDAAIVLVLIPGSMFLMGAQGEDETKPNYDPEAADDETPHEVTLSPHFLAKHECTQSQWSVLTAGLDPSQYAVGDWVRGNRVTPRNPVERVSWEDCNLWLRRWNLALPTEAWWEHACRAGTDTPRHTGHTVASLQGYANILDAYKMAHGGPPNAPYATEVDDGHVVHAPVGTYRPNRFGLHDMHGNVWEWCRDFYAAYPDEPVEDPFRAEGMGFRVPRGGSWRDPAKSVRSAYRAWYEPRTRFMNLGVRPARALD